ncbi:hypothetical protein [Sphingomonas sp. 28-63-12]|uniref:hypothetical protein n=1 Tax=Sphingomonas sp. 28-63-12 TaxID=1970434 RepID=UPI0035A93569
MNAIAHGDLNGAIVICMTPRIFFEGGGGVGVGVGVGVGIDGVTVTGGCDPPLPPHPDRMLKVAARPTTRHFIALAELIRMLDMVGFITPEAVRDRGSFD